jgi:hypothetical protein
METVTSRKRKRFRHVSNASAGQPNFPNRLRKRRMVVEGYDQEKPVATMRMTTVQILLPDQLAQDAQRAGLLAPELLEKWLREQLKAQHVDQLFSAMDRMSAIDDPPIMSPEEIAAKRAERRADTSQ